MLLSEACIPTHTACAIPKRLFMTFQHQVQEYGVAIKVENFDAILKANIRLTKLMLHWSHTLYGRASIFNLLLIAFHAKKDTSIYKLIKKHPLMLNEEGGEVLFGMMSSYAAAHRLDRSDVEHMQDALVFVGNVAKDSAGFRCEELQRQQGKFHVQSKHRKVKDDSKEVQKTVEFLKLFMKSIVKPNSRFLLKKKNGNLKQVALVKKDDIPQRFDKMLRRTKFDLKQRWVHTHSQDVWPDCRPDGSTSEEHSAFEDPVAPDRENLPVMLPFSS